MKWQVNLIVTPKPGVNDPEGEAILNGLHSLGMESFDRVVAGRHFVLTVEASDETGAAEQAIAAAEKLLANPVVEVYQLGDISPVREQVEHR